MLLTVTVLGIVLLACAVSAAPAVRPDQVLVVYNKDWTQDLDDSEPGQDSEEVALYYVARRTDLETGLRPYLLGLSATNRNQSVLNQVVLPERSRDNWFGLRFKGAGELVCDPWPLASRTGEIAIPVNRLVEGRGAPRYAVIFLTAEDIGGNMPAELTIRVEGPDGRIHHFFPLRSGEEMSSVTYVFRERAGLVITVDVLDLGLRQARVEAMASIPGRPALTVAGECLASPASRGVDDFVPVKPQDPKMLPAFRKSKVLEVLYSEPALLALVSQTHVAGLYLSPGDLATLEENSIEIGVEPLQQPEQFRLVYSHGRPVGDADVCVYRTGDGGILFSTDFENVFPGTVRVTISATDKKGKPGGYRRQLILYDRRDFAPSETGPDGIRDDQVYLETIEEPIKRFLESTRTADGKVLKDHILHIVVVHGLPLQVASLYGIERGSNTATKREGSFGAGSALTQRIRMLYYDVKRVEWRPVIMLNGGEGDEPVLPNISHIMKLCLIGPRYNPYLHPLAHNRQLREAVWQEGQWQAVRRLDPPHFTTELRAQQPPEQFLYGAGRIDGPSVEIACSQIDGAIYAERYLTPALGPVYYGAYQEGPLAAEALRLLGFDVRPIPARAERALLIFGVFGYGATYAEDVRSDPWGYGGLSCVWKKGFLPGSMACVMRSFLGWDRVRPPRSAVRLFDQVVRAGVTVTAGSAGGAHETNSSWWDNLVFHHLMFSGRPFGEATLRSMPYLDWTISLVGDPLYAPDLSRTTPDVTPPRVAAPDSIRFTAADCGGNKQALRVEVTLANQDPEMAEIRVECKPRQGGGPTVVAENTRYLARPSVIVTGLAPETEYTVFVTLKDPYGNSFESAKAFGPLVVKTGRSHAGQVLLERSFPSVEWKPPVTVILAEAQFDEAGEVDLYFTSGKGSGEKMPLLKTAEGKILFGAECGLRIGGAQTGFGGWNGISLESGQQWHARIRWRRYPVTREVYLVARDGTAFLVASANELPWDPADRIGPRLVLDGRSRVTRIRLANNPP
ncbi:MAG: hypothetical protein ACUVWX_12435, partial [Kiritimatiellia bacterium]